MPEQLVLSVVTGDGTAQPDRTVALPVVLGRDPDHAGIVLDDRMVSRRHARLEQDGASVVVVDLGSGNGTWVGEEEVRRRVLRPGERLTIGECTVSWAPATSPLPELDLGPAWYVAVVDGRLRAVPLQDLFTTWRDAARAAGGPGAVDADRLARLTTHTIAACTPATDPTPVATALAAGHRPHDPTGLAAALRAGVAVFVEHGRAATSAGATDLLAALRAITAAVTPTVPESVRSS